MSPTTQSPQPLPATPALDALLDGLRSRLRRSVWLHGLGTLLAVVAGWAVLAFLGDWLLRVPGPVRLFHTLGLFGLVGFFAWRDLWRPLQRIPDRAGLAVLVEREHPELNELLVSAVEFQAPQGLGAGADVVGSSDMRGAPALRASVVTTAEARARELSAARVVDAQRPRRRIQGGVFALGLVVALAATFPAYSSTFLARMFGAGPSWPQRTQLALEIPDLGEGTEVAAGPEEIRVRVARGTDVPVVVRASGVVPDEVTLHFDGGRDLALNPTGAGLFRTLLRSLQEDTTFHVTGGDDRDGLPVVRVEVLQPPDLEGLALAVTPPEYTGLPEQLAFDRDVEVLAGSRVVVTALASPPDATGHARILPEDRRIPLEPQPFPADPAAGDAPTPPDEGLGFELWADRSVGFRIELQDDKGLSNPDPGLFRVQVIEDRAPEVQVLVPTRGEVEVVLGGALPLRARIEDDFGLAGAGWALLGSNAEESSGAGDGTFALVPLESEGQPDGSRSSEGRARESALASVRLEVDDLAGPDGTVAADQRYELLVHARDNRAPEANEGRSFPIRIRVVTPEELLRRMQDRLGAARLSALRLSDLQGEKRARTEELYTALDAADASLDSRALSSAIAGQRRVVADARALARELAGVAEDVLYARIEEKAEGLLEAYDTRVARSADARFRPEPWREVAAALESGRLRDAGFAGKLVTLVELSLLVSEDDAPGASERLAEAERALGVDAAADELAAALELQDQTLRRIETLVDELAQWNNFQDVLQLTRDILNRQRSLRERTETFAKERDR